MAKVKVQDATRELRAGVDELLKSVSQSRKRTFDVMKSLKRLTDELDRQEREKKAQEQREILNRQYRDAASFMTAYSSEQVPEPIAQTAPPEETQAAQAAP
ncbi:MAG: hypothetical protein IKE30_01130, partial [Clostridia bacterium]|nr:hypothetical protein [Clostridia bacterium]